MQTPMSVRVVQWLAAVGLVVGGAPLDAGAQDPSSERGAYGSAFEHLDETVLVDLEKELVYLLTTDDKFEGRRLATGDRVWKWDRAAKPLYRHDDRLLVRTALPSEGAMETMDYAVLDVDDGSVACKARLEAPDAPTTSLQDEMERGTHSRVVVRGGRFYLLWSSSYDPYSPMPRENASDRGRDVEGAARVDFEDCELRAVDREKLPGRTSGKTGRGGARAPDSHGGPPRTFKFGDRTVRATLEDSDDDGAGERLVAERLDESGQTASTATLFDPDEGVDLSFYDAFSRCCVVVRSSPAARGKQATLRVFDMEHERELGTWPPGLAPMVMTPEIGLYVPGGRRLVALEYGSDQPVWTVEFGSFAYEGPLPPSAPPGPP